MKKTIIVLATVSSLAVLQGCTVDTVSAADTYYPSSSVYTAGFYDTSPYWGNTYYVGYGTGWGNYNYYRGGSRFYNRGYYGGRGYYAGRGWGRGAYRGGYGGFRGGHRR